MELSERLEFLIEIASVIWPESHQDAFEPLRMNYFADRNLVIPHQWLLVSKRPPRVRQDLRHMASELQEGCAAMLGLLDTLDAAEAEAQRAGHPEWARFIALHKAPLALQKPETTNTSDVEELIVMLRDIMYQGSWQENIAWIERQGGPEQQEEIATLQSYALFEQTYGVNLRDLLFTAEENAMNEELGRAYARGGVDEVGRVERRLNRARRAARPKRKRRRG
ncbi:MAG: hypothetical protein FJZ89_10935 [Chloroflexi bacterium]|nr:hypothetical protein [Chloroflexota bacterium]